MKFAAVSMVLAILPVPMFGQNLTVRSGHSQMDSAKWTYIELRATQSYKAANGLAVLPQIAERCDAQQGSAGNNGITVFFDTGMVVPQSDLRIRFGSAEALEVLYGEHSTFCNDAGGFENRSSPIHAFYVAWASSGHVPYEWVTGCAEATGMCCGGKSRANGVGYGKGSHDCF